eukprot:gene24628-biopygen16436
MKVHDSHTWSSRLITQLHLAESYFLDTWIRNPNTIPYTDDGGDGGGGGGCCCGGMWSAWRGIVGLAASAGQAQAGQGAL